MSISILLMAAAFATDPVADPISPAKGGMLQCYVPDDTNKTCRSLAGYVAKDDGSYVNDATVLISLEPLVTLQTSSIVRVKDNAICGPVTEREFQAGKVLLDGQTLPPSTASAIRAQVGKAMASFIGKEICTTYTPGAGAWLVADVTVDGVARPDLRQNVRWVQPTDGYRIAP